MRKFKTKMASIFMALACAFACLGVGVFVSNNKAIEAKAEEFTTYTITQVGASADSDSTMLYLFAVEGDQLPEVDDDNWDWDNLYEFEEGSGEGVTLNGEAIPVGEMLLPCDFYVYFGDEISAVEGDVFAIDGAFYSEETGIKVVFVNCSLQFDGSMWVANEAETPDPEPEPEPEPEPDGYTTHEMGALQLHVNSKPIGAAGGQHSAIYLERADGEALPVQTWDVAFVAENAENFKINGENATFEMKSTDAGLYINFGRDLDRAVGPVVAAAKGMEVFFQFPADCVKHNAVRDHEPVNILHRGKIARLCLITGVDPLSGQVIRIIGGDRQGSADIDQIASIDDMAVLVLTRQTGFYLSDDCAAVPVQLIQRSVTAAALRNMAGVDVSVRDDNGAVADLCCPNLLHAGVGGQGIIHHGVVIRTAVGTGPLHTSGGFVMEYVEANTLKCRVEECGALTFEETLYYTKQILDALIHTHERGVVHCDLKPQNIMLLPDGNIKLTDFGIARIIDSEENKESDTAVGTVYYISPEQASGRRLDGRSDIYSLGVMMYEMATGRLPFSAEDTSSVSKKSNAWPVLHC